MYTVVTSFNEKYWNELTSTTTRELDKNWHKESKLLFYHELPKAVTKKSIGGFSNRCEWIDLYKDCPALPAFAEKWKDHPKANGAKGFKWDAVKFCHKTFAIWQAWRKTQTGWLIWMDADSLFHKPFDDRFKSIVFGRDIIAAYIGRPHKYSECGFMAFNLDNPETHKFMEQWEELFLSGEFINLPQTHDSYTFDVMRKNFDPKLFYDLNVAKSGKHPIHASLVGPYINHSKGKDKSYKVNKFLSRQAQAS